MPIISLCSSAEEFHEKAGHWLAEKEVQNNSCLIVVSNLLSKPVSERFEHYFWIVEDAGAIVGTAFWTPPYKFTVSEMEKESLMALANALRVSHPNIPGVGGPKEPAKYFSHFWNLKTQKSPLLEHSMRIYQLEKVMSPSARPGKLQKAQEKDVEFLAEWLRQFHAEISVSEELDIRNIVENYIREQRLFAWEDGGYRAMAAYAGSTLNGVRLNMVYTPSEFRGKGYATSLVASLSQSLLDSGKKFCCLYTDLLNPTSNSIYQKIGYQPVCDWNVYKFK
jgi:predicted GNAT family acetyltransferase